MINQVDYQGNNKINYTEFLSATIDPKELNNEQRIKGIFNLFDIDNTQSISVENLVQTFSKFGRVITVEEVNETLRAHDLNQEGTISFEEFKTMIVGE